MRLWRLIPQADDNAAPGIPIWLRRWFASMAILCIGVVALLVVPIRDHCEVPWASIFHLSRVGFDCRVNLLGEPVAWYLFLFLPLLAWHLLDVRYITLRPVTAGRWDRLGYRVMSLSLAVTALCAAASHSRLFLITIHDDQVYGFDGGGFYQPDWLGDLWDTAIFILCCGVFERLVRAIALLFARLRRGPSV